MNLIVFGATGGTGRQVVAQALTAGHAVTAVARRRDALAIRHDRLAVLHGDVLEPATLAQPLAGQDAVVSALGVRSRAPTTVFSAGVSNIIQAMEAAGVRRLICISAAGLDPGFGLLRWIAKSILYAMLRHAYDDMRRMEALVKDSGLDWTIIRAPMLMDEPRTGQYQIATNKHLARGRSIARADLADYIVTHLSIFMVVGTSDNIVYSLTHPAEFRSFVLVVFLLAMALIGVGAGIAATVQNYRGGERRAPTALPVALATLVGVAAGAILVAAVAGSSENAGVSPAALAALPALKTANFAFDQAELRVKAGETVALRLENSDTVRHSFDVDEFGIHAPMPSGQRSLALFKPEAPGTYTFYCAPHYDKATGEGMKGILIVD